MNRTLVGEVQALCTATVLDQQTLELARSLELRSGAYRAPALPVELYQRSWRGGSNADHGLTRPALFQLSYTSTNSGGGGENCTPDNLLCRQTPCCLGYTASTLERSTGIAPVLPDWRSGVLLLYELRNGASSESRTRVIGLEARGTSRYTMLALLKTLAGVAGFEPAKTGFGDQRPSHRVLTLWRSQRELNSSLLIDSQASCR